MEKSYSESYAAAGVDITAGYRSVELMKQYVARTMNEHCIGGLGGFGGLFEMCIRDRSEPCTIHCAGRRFHCHQIGWSIHLAWILYIFLGEVR